MRISFKLLVCCFSTIMLIFVLLNTVGESIFENRSFKNIKSQYHEIASDISDDIVTNFYNKEGDIKPIREEIARISMLLGARIWLINANGSVIADSVCGTADSWISAEDYDRIILDSAFTENIRPNDSFEEDMLVVTEPLYYNYRSSGYVCVMVPMSLKEDNAMNDLNTMNIIFIMIMGIILIGYFFTYFINIIPIKRIKKAAMEYSKGNYDYKMRIRSSDEYMDLSNTISYMVSELRQAEEKQRKLIANVSHDFRSPLTSIKGYAEAIKDGTIPYEAKDKYLDIILFEADRLHKLTSNILELNSMDNNGLMLDIRSFDINSIIRKIADSFEGRCRQKRLIIKLMFDEKETFVDGDMDRIEQVIYNLTDNAIKFSNPDSELLIGVEVKGGKAFIRVKDSGCGISKDSLNRIWDRFYKGDVSRGKDKKGTGLGLSIVKEIISEHGENINVISTEGVGTEFTFSLPVS